MLNNDELKVKEALEYFGFGVQEVSSRDIEYKYLSLKKRYNPDTCENELYKDGVEYNKMLSYYEEIKDVRRTNEIVHNILDPNHKEHYYTKPDYKEEEVKPEIVDEIPNMGNKIPNDMFGDVKIADKPTLFSIIITLLLPIYGFITSILIRPLMPKASRWYLVFAIIGFVINFVIMFFLYRV